MKEVCESILFNTGSPLLESNVVTSDLSTPRKYQCTECTKSFSRPSALQTHSYTHTKEKPFKCNINGCGSSFSVVSNLRRHFKVHRRHNNSDRLSPEDRIRCVRRHIREVEALQYRQQQQQQQQLQLQLRLQFQQQQQQFQEQQQQAMTDTSSNSSVSSVSSSSSSSSSGSSIYTLASLCIGTRFYFLDKPEHNDFDSPLLSPILYNEASPSPKEDVLEPPSDL